MIQVEQVSGLKCFVGRVVDFLIDADDEDGERLRHEGRGILCSADLIEAAVEYGFASAREEEELRSLVGRARALVEETRRYAAKRKLDFLTVPASPVPPRAA